jgi:hypothetical protein
MEESKHTSATVLQGAGGVASGALEGVVFEKNGRIRAKPLTPHRKRKKK